MAAAANQTKDKFDRSEFKERGVKYYDARAVNFTYCSVTGWHDSSLVKAAHLVPKSLAGNEVADLFGSPETPVRTDPRNGNLFKFLRRNAC